MGKGGSGRKRGSKKPKRYKGRRVSTRFLLEHVGTTEELKEKVREWLMELQVDAIEVLRRVLQGEVEGVKPNELLKYQIRAANSVLDHTLPKQSEHQHVVTRIEVHTGVPLEEGEEKKGEIDVTPEPKALQGIEGLEELKEDERSEIQN